MADIVVDFRKREGTVKPLHGLNNGPVCYDSCIDVSGYYKEAGIPFVRLHDTDWPNPRQVDIVHIFPNFDADPEDPASYDFEQTDDIITAIAATNAQIIYRLGASIEHQRSKMHVFPPKDNKKWAQICVGIIRHYNHGWAKGFHYGIRYWEIWNEADGGDGKMWNGTAQQHHEMYCVASKAIKALDPSLKVGGYAACALRSNFMHEFLEYCVKEKAPLDFFSWHLYFRHIAEVEENSAYIMNLLDKYGFGGIETILDEWNYFESEYWGKIWTAPGYENSARAREEIFEKQKNMIGAAFCAAVMIRMQTLPVDIAAYYDGQPTALFCGLFNPYGNSRKTFHTFKAFQELYSLKIRVHAVCGDKNIYCGASGESGNGCILVSNYEGSAREYSLEVQGLDGENTLRVHLLDECYNLDRIYSVSCCGNATLTLPLQQNAVAMIKVTTA